MEPHLTPVIPLCVCQCMYMWYVNGVAAGGAERPSVLVRSLSHTHTRPTHKEPFISTLMNSIRIYYLSVRCLW